VSDAASRQLLRAWRTRPGDQSTLAQVVNALEREGEPLPTDVLEARRSPARHFESPNELEVYVQPPAGEARLVGTTTAGGVEVPEARFWWVRPRPIALTEEVARDLAARSVTGLSLATAKIGSADQLAHLVDLPDLTYLALPSCSGVDDECLKSIARCTDLESLDLSGRKRFRRGGLKALAALPRLVRLDLSRAAQLQAADLAPLGSFSRLAHLSLASNECRGPWLKHLAGLNELRSLDLRAVKNLSGKAFRSLPSLPNLLRLNVRETGVTSPGLSALRQAPRLRSLTLTGPYQAKALSVLEELPDLFDLSLAADPEIKGVGGVLARLESLRELSVERGLGSGWTEALPCLERLEELNLYRAEPNDLRLLGACRELRRLVVRSYPFSRIELEPLGDLARLEELELASTSALIAVEVVKGLPSLVSFNLELPFARQEERVTHQDLAGLGACSGLRHLILGRAALSASLLQSLQSLELESLELWNSYLEPGAWQALGEWKSLRSLKVSPWLSSEEAETAANPIPDLAGCEELEELDLRLSRLESGDCDAFQSFSKLKRLTLHLRGSANLTPAQLRRLRGSLPACAIHVTRD